MIRFFSVASILAMLVAPASAQDSDWPREIVTPEATVVIYQPQVERFTEDEIESRAAVSVKTPDNPEPVFGAVWTTARVNIDRDQRVVTFEDIRVPNVRFADATDEDKDEFAKLLEREFPKWELEIALDRLIPLLEVAEHEDPQDPGLKHDPPKIIVTDKPTTLVIIDGEPKLKAVDKPKDAVKKDIERVVNTPVLIAHYPKKKTYYLAGGGELWYEAPEALGPYTPIKKPPKAVRVLTEGAATDSETPDGDPPEIIVTTEPTELIVAAGELEYVPLGDIDVLAVSNADRDVILETGANDHYVLLSGRWFVSSNKLNGPWRFVPPSELPEAFAQIPADSERAHLRAHVPGTVEAKEAVLDNTIPQTSAIKRDDTSFKATYDGVPKFEPIEGVEAQAAANSPQSVFIVNERYYACDQGVWYVSNAPTGPWAVATKVPDVLYDIPASNPHHNVTYVKVYDVTPQVVYVGYTPGYVGSYVYGGCVVWGTGWYYPGWYGRYYYPRPYTWGFHATYNPWHGWGFGVSWSSGPLTISIGTGGWGWGRSWWGPCGYRPYYPHHRPPYYPGYRPPYYPGYRPPHYPGHRPPAGGTRPPTIQPLPGSPAQLPSAGTGAQPRTNNLYARQDNATRNAARPSTSDRARPSTAQSRPNNVYSDRSGNVYRRDQGGNWQQRQGGGWQPNIGGPTTRPSQPGGGSPSTRPSTRPLQPSAGSPSTRPSTRPSQPSTGSLNRDYGARSRGQTRSQQYRSAPRPSTSRGGSMNRGGGGRRR